MKERLKEILKIQSESFNQWRMFAYLIRRLKKGSEVDWYVDNGNIYVTKGQAENYPCIVAHMDTVHDIVDDLSLIEVGNKITGFNRTTMSQTGVGGDDKVGIFIALEVLEKVDAVKIAFFRDEEVGCLGSNEADMKFFDNVSFVLQCDRKGNDEFINVAAGTPLCSKSFRKEVSKIISKYGYKFGQGLWTDVSALKENGLKVSAANIGCGYYNPHTPREYVDADDVQNCLSLVLAIIRDVGNTKFEHTHHGRGRWGTMKSSKAGFNYGTYGGKYGNYGYHDNWHDTLPQSSSVNEEEKPPTQCDSCREESSTKYNRELNLFLCNTCHNFLR